MKSIINDHIEKLEGELILCVPGALERSSGQVRVDSVPDPAELTCDGLGLFRIVALGSHFGYSYVQYISIACYQFLIM